MLEALTWCSFSFFLFQTGKAVLVQVGPGLDANTDTTPSAWKKKLERLQVHTGKSRLFCVFLFSDDSLFFQAGYKGPQQVKSQIAAVRAQKVSEKSEKKKEKKLKFGAGRNVGL